MVGFILISFLTGILLPVQAGLNAKLGKVAGGPMVAALISFVVGTLALLLFLLISRKHPIQWSGIQSAPVWLFAGGIIGALYIAMSTYIVPVLGAALTFGLVITGQLIAAMILDHFGWLGMAVKEISMGRIIGAILLIAGVLLIRKY